MLLITHDLRLAAHVCDDVAVMYAGDQVEYGPARDVLRRPRHPYTWALEYATPDVTGRSAAADAQRQMPGFSALGYRRLPLRARAARNAAGLHAAAARPGRTAPPGHWVRASRRANSRRTMRRRATASSGAPGKRRAATAAPPLVELQDATLRYTARRGLLGQRKVHNVAVKRLSLKVQPGEFVGIVGESGSGKSSVARLIVGAEALTSGRLLIEGQDRTLAARRAAAERASTCR